MPFVLLLILMLGCRKAGDTYVSSKMDQGNCVERTQVWVHNEEFEGWKTSEAWHVVGCPPPPVETLHEDNSGMVLMFGSTGLLF